MKQIHLMFALILLLASTNVATAMLIAETAEIPYQINNSDRIIIGTVTEIQPFYDHTIVTIGVDEWLMNPLSTETITVRTKIGTNLWTEDEPTFALNETIILMLEDVSISEDRFGVVFGEPGKHPLSDRDAVLQELDAREQAQIEGNFEYKIVEYPPSPVEFILPTSDHGLDMDGDGLYDYLILELNARTTAPGWYRLTGELYVPLGTYEENAMKKTGIQIQIIEFASTVVYLNKTVQSVAINFKGGRIRDNQINGPYEVSILMNNEKWDFGNVLDCTTGEYDHTEFEQPVVLLSGPVRSKADAIGLARQKAAEIGVTVGEVNCTEIMVDYSDELWALYFKGETFDERFVVYGNTTDEIVHMTMNATRNRAPINRVPFIGTAGVLAVLLGAILLARIKR